MDNDSKTITVPLELWQEINDVLSARQFIYVEDGFPENDDEVIDLLNRLKEVK